MPAIEEVAKKYDDAELWHLYVREPHPQERKFKKYFPHKNYEDRIAYAQELREVMNIESPIVLDGMDEKIHLRYGNMPNAVYVVDKKGNVVYKANWTDAPVVDEVLAELQAEEAKTTDNRQQTTDKRRRREAEDRGQEERIKRRPQTRREKRRFLKLGT